MEVAEQCMRLENDNNVE